MNRSVVTQTLYHHWLVTTFVTVIGPPTTVTREVSTSPTNITSGSLTSSTVAPTAPTHENTAENTTSKLDIVQVVFQVFILLLLLIGYWKLWHWHQKVDVSSEIEATIETSPEPNLDYKLASNASSLVANPKLLTQEEKEPHHSEPSNIAPVKRNTL